MLPPTGFSLHGSDGSVSSAVDRGFDTLDAMTKQASVPVLRLVTLTLVVAMPMLLFTTAHSATSPDRGDFRWLDIEGQPLPFQDDATILHVIRTATVASREIGGMVAPDAELLVLDHRNTRFHVVFRTIDDSTRVPPSGDSRRSTVRYRDAAVFESAAYELADLLGIGRVPPATERRVDERFGTVQIWLEGTLSQADLDQRDQLHPPDLERWARQLQILLVFDNLIANTGRNPSNVLVDAGWNMWFTDHTHAFRQVSKLLFKEDQVGCERQLWAALNEIDDEAIQQRLEPYLEAREISELLLRRTKLVQHLKKLIKKRGEDAVIFDLRPASG